VIRRRRATPADSTVQPARRPLYWRVLGLHHVRPNGWQRALLVEGVIVVAAVLVLAGVASIWTLLALPIVVAVLVKLNDLLVAGMRNGAARNRD
jgi:hypothetical protein